MQADGQFRLVVEFARALPPKPWSDYVPETAGYTCDQREGALRFCSLWMVAAMTHIRLGSSLRH